MGNLSDAKGQLTPQSVVGSGQTSNSSELSCMSSLPTRMKRIGSKTAEKKWQHSFIFILTLSVAMETSSWIWPISNSSKLSCMSSLHASMKWIRSRIAEKKWQHRFSHYKSMGIFSDAQGQLTPQSVVRSG